MDVRILEDVRKFLDRLKDDDSAKILAHLKSLEESHTEGLLIKTLKDKIKEIVVRQYRIIFFNIGGTIYIVDAFKKQSQKTPKRIIEKAEKIYKGLKTQTFLK